MINVVYMSMLNVIVLNQIQDFIKLPPCGTIDTVLNMTSLVNYFCKTIWVKVFKYFISP